MCNSWNITYSCGHSRHVRVQVNTCRGTTKEKTKPFSEPRAACCSPPIYSLRATITCGQCLREKDETALEETLNILKASLTSDHPDFGAAEAEYNSQIYLLTRRFPDRKVKPYKRVMAQQPVTSLRHSLLRKEVLLDEVVDNAWHDYAKSWSKPYGNIAEETTEYGEESNAEGTITSDDAGNEWSGPVDWALELSSTETETLETPDIWSAPEAWTFESEPTEIETEISSTAAALLSAVENVSSENVPPAPGFTTLDSAPEHEIINVDLDPSNTFKVLPPYLKHHKATVMRSRSKSRSSTEATKTDIDLYKNFRCLPLQYVMTMSS